MRANLSPHPSVVAPVSPVFTLSVSLADPSRRRVVVVCSPPLLLLSQDVLSFTSVSQHSLMVSSFSRRPGGSNRQQQPQQPRRDLLRQVKRLKRNTDDGEREREAGRGRKGVRGVRMRASARFRWEWRRRKAGCPGKKKRIFRNNREDVFTCTYLCTFLSFSPA